MPLTNNNLLTKAYRILTTQTLQKKNGGNQPRLSLTPTLKSTIYIYIYQSSNLVSKGPRNPEAS